jgi:phage shock protein C
MEHPISTERRPLSDWHRGGPERRIAGVCTALARELNVPLPALRAAFVLAIALPGIRVLAAGLYLALWFVMPPAADEPSGLDRVIVGIEDLFSVREDRPKQDR